jgi:hypothetical protein
MRQQGVHQHDAPAQQHSEVDSSHTSAQPGAPHDSEQVHEECDEFADGDDAWAGDHDERDIHQFEAVGQDFSHELQADEKHWESGPAAKSLPPGWGNCPNSGTMLMGMLPIKVLLHLPIMNEQCVSFAANLSLKPTRFGTYGQLTGHMWIAY